MFSEVCLLREGSVKTLELSWGVTASPCMEGETLTYRFVKVLYTIQLLFEHINLDLQSSFELYIVAFVLLSNFFGCDIWFLLWFSIFIKT